MMDRLATAISTGRYKADLVCEIECDGYLIEHDMTPITTKYLGNKQLGVGAVDVQAPQCRDRTSKLPSGSKRMDGSRRNKRSSPAPAASIIFRGTLRLAK